MESNEFLLGAGAVFLGAILTIIVEGSRTWLERRQLRQDRCDDFQRQTLLDIQDALDAQFALTCEMYLHRQRSTKISDELAEAHRKAASRVKILLVRRPDRQLQEHVEAFEGYVQRVLYVPDVHYKAGIAFKYMGESFEAAIRRTGELLSKL